MTRYHRHIAQKRHRTIVVKKQTKPKLVDRLTYIAAFVEPVVTIPQAYAIFHAKTAAGVSISTWLGYEFFTFIWLWYGFVHKEKPIIVYQGLFLVIQTFVIIGALMYGGAF